MSVSWEKIKLKPIGRSYWKNTMKDEAWLRMAVYARKDGKNITRHYEGTLSDVIANAEKDAIEENLFIKSVSCIDAGWNFISFPGLPTVKKEN